LFAWSLRRQNARPVRRSLPFGEGGLPAGIELFFSHFIGLQCFGQPCQKQPSTKTTVRSFLKTISGRTVSDG